MQSCTFRGDSIWFHSEGRGRAVVLLHGFLGSAEIWTQLRADLSRSYRVISIDLPGHGSSASYGYVHTMELMAGAVKAVADHLRIKKMVLVGHSMGGYVALAFADLYPDHVRGLCLFHSTAYPDTPEKKNDRLRAIALIRQDRRLFSRQTITALFARKNLRYLKKEIAFAASIARKTGARGMAAALRGMRDRPARDLIIALVDYPVLFVIGEQDPVLPAGQLLEQCQAAKKGSVLYLEHDGHYGFLESPVESRRALRKFLRRCFS